MEKGIYSEKLSSGGELKVSSNNWFIEYYFPGPDFRYNGKFFKISGRDIDRYIAALEKNFEKYLELKAAIPPTGNFETSGEMGMTIFIGDHRNGVCLHNYHMPISSEEKLKLVISDYKNAKVRAEKIQDMLKNL